MTSKPGPGTAPHPAIEIVATRGVAGQGTVESCHQVHGVAITSEGKIEAAFGNPDLLLFPRSSVKAIQSLPLIETGAAQAHAVTPAELALACASHLGEPFHTETVMAWLERIGLDEDALACGPQDPRRTEDLKALMRADMPIGRRHNNCSGKHAGMLTTALHMGEALAGYADRHHPVQRRVFATFAEMMALPGTDITYGVDGCSAPNPAMTLRQIATGAARFAGADAAVLGADRADACRQMMAAMTLHPEMVGGTGRLDTDLIRASGGRILSKTGAEGVYVMYLPEQGLGIALKALDGAARAAEAGVWSVLSELGLLDGQVEQALRPHCRPEIRNWDGLVTGLLMDRREYRGS